MNKAIKIVLGLLLMVVGLYSYFLKFSWIWPWQQFVMLVKLVIGNLGLLVILIGLILLLLGFSELKD